MNVFKKIYIMILLAHAEAEDKRNMKKEVIK